MVGTMFEKYIRRTVGLQLTPSQRPLRVAKAEMPEASERRPPLTVLMNVACAASAGILRYRF